MRTLVLYLLIAFQSSAAQAGTKKDYKVEMPKTTKFTFSRGSTLLGRTPSSLESFLTARRKTKYKRLYKYRQNFRKKIRRSVSDL